MARWLTGLTGRGLTASVVVTLAACKAPQPTPPLVPDTVEPEPDEPEPDEPEPDEPDPSEPEPDGAAPSEVAEAGPSPTIDVPVTWSPRPCGPTPKLHRFDVPAYALQPRAFAAELDDGVAVMHAWMERESSASKSGTRTWSRSCRGWRRRD